MRPEHDRRALSPAAKHAYPATIPRLLLARSAAGTLLGLVALSVFVVVYGRLCPFARPVVCLLAGWGAFLAAVAILDNFHPPALVSLIVVAAAFALGIKLLPAPEGQVGEIGPLPSWDLPARALAALGSCSRSRPLRDRWGRG